MTTVDGASAVCPQRKPVVSTDLSSAQIRTRFTARLANSLLLLNHFFSRSQGHGPAQTLIRLNGRDLQARSSKARAWALQRMPSPQRQVFRSKPINVIIYVVSYGSGARINGATGPDINLAKLFDRIAKHGKD